LTLVAPMGDPDRVECKSNEMGAWAGKTAEADWLVADLGLACIGRFVAAALGDLRCLLTRLGSFRITWVGAAHVRWVQLGRVDVGEVTLRMRYGGEGEPVVL